MFLKSSSQKLISCKILLAEHLIGGRAEEREGIAQLEDQLLMVIWSAINTVLVLPYLTCQTEQSTLKHLTLFRENMVGLAASFLTQQTLFSVFILSDVRCVSLLSPRTAVMMPAIQIFPAENKNWGCSWGGSCYHSPSAITVIRTIHTQNRREKVVLKKYWNTDNFKCAVFSQVLI